MNNPQRKLLAPFTHGSVWFWVDAIRYEQLRELCRLSGYGVRTSIPIDRESTILYCAKELASEGEFLKEYDRMNDLLARVAKNVPVYFELAFFESGQTESRFTRVAGTAGKATVSSDRPARFR